MSVHRRTDGNSRVRWQVKWREDGRQRSRTFDLKRDADAYDTEVRRRTRLGPLAVQQLTTKGPTLNEWYTGPWSREHGATLASRTRKTYSTVYAKHVVQELGDVHLRELTPSKLREWQAGRLEAGVSPSTVRHARALLSSALRHAAESEVIAGNPLSVVRAPKLPRSAAVRPLPPKTVEAIRRAMMEPRVIVGDSAEGKRARKGYTAVSTRTAERCEQDALLVSLLAYAGLRPSEALALRWDDVGKNTLLVERAADSDGNVKTTKTEQRRTVRLLAPLAADLGAWAKTSGRMGWVLDGRPWSEEEYRRWRSRTWRGACKAAGLDPVPRPYDLRHSFASLLLAESLSIHDVAHQLGHAPTQTLDTYGHVIEEFRGRRRVDANAEIRRARSGASSR